MLINLLFFLLLFGLFAIIILAFIVYRLFSMTGLGKIFDLLRKGGSSSYANPNTSYGQQQGTRQRTTTPQGDVIIDQRNPDKANQKIFDQSEGEYVDYKEE